MILVLTSRQISWFTVQPLLFYFSADLRDLRYILWLQILCIALQKKKCEICVAQLVNAVNPVFLSGAILSEAFHIMC